MEKLLLIDGNSILNRAYFAMYGRNMLSTSEGIYTNALFGFLNTYEKFIKSEHPTHVLVAFDLKHPTFRHEKYKAYKAGRKPMAEELVMQMPIAKEMLDAMGIPRLEIKGYEADDIIGTASQKAGEIGMDTVVLTGDRDMIQLTGEHCEVKIPTTRKGNPVVNEFTLESVRKDYGIEPDDFIQVKALMGDKSDNIPGVAGVGEKTALKFISKYKTLENLYDHLDEIKSDKMREKLERDRDNAFLSRELGLICRDCPMDFDIRDMKLNDPDKEKLLDLFKKLEFTSFIRKYGLNEMEAESVEFTVSTDGFTSMGKAVVYCKFNDKGELVEMAATEDGKVIYIFNETDKIIDALKKIEVISGHYLKNILIYMLEEDIDLPAVSFDTAAAAYLVDALKDTYGVNELCLKYLEKTFPEKDDCACRAAKVYHLEKKMTVLIDEMGLKDLLNEVELPLIEVLAYMEKIGFKADRKFLNDFSEKLDEGIEELEKSIFEETGEEFNINSPKQLGTILFEKMNLPYGKKTKAGFSTKAEILEKLAPEFRVAGLVLEYRKLSKLKSTYAEGLVKSIKEDGRIHSKFRQTVTATGRLSSTEPNLQNLPIRTERGREIRKAFVPGDENYLLTSADYSQIELRVLAHVADDADMKKAFMEGHDIHTMTAAKVFGVDDRFVTSEMRRTAKAVNFGIIYGISDYSLSQDINVSVKTAKEYIIEYLNTYSGIRKYMKDVVDFAKENGYVQTIFGRRRYLPELNSKNYIQREFGKRVALNAPIQGAAADIIKKAMNDVYYRLKDRNMKSRLILQVHDELVIETHVKEVKEVEELLKTCMEKTVELSVPLIVEAKTGKNLYETK